MQVLSVALLTVLSAPPAPETVSFRFAWPAGLSADVEHQRSRTRAEKNTSLRLQARLAVELRISAHLHGRALSSSSVTTA
jgi:hypothetical protein